MKHFVLAITLLGLSACNPSDFDAAKTPTRDQSIDLYRPLTEETGFLQQFLSDTTVRTYSSADGNQIEYHGADGQIWLVYFGNRRAVRGEWKTDIYEGPESSEKRTRNY